MELLNRSRCFEGHVDFYKHASDTCQAEMRFSVFVPPQASSRKVPILYWLSGLTCSEENFMIKAGAQKYAAEHGILLVAPDTSPRKTGIEGEDKDWECGTGAGFYVNAVTPKWSRHYQMYDYVSQELPGLIHKNFPVLPDESISGHSMGGHGALILALRQPGRYCSVSAFSPIVAPRKCPWGQKAFTEFLGLDTTKWKDYDSSFLMSQCREKFPILVDQGTNDKFLTTQLMPAELESVAKNSGFPLTLRMQKGYDHSYYFISSFIEEHIQYHSKALNRY